MEWKLLDSIFPKLTRPLGGRYQIIRQLGAGGFGQTFLAHDLHLPGQPICVVKQLKPQTQGEKELQVARRLFDTEAQVLYQLGNHPQIPRLLAHFEDGREFYLAQELIEGHALADELAIAVQWPDGDVVAFLMDVLQTLSFVHENRVIHRDLKPSNLIRRASDHRIVLIDFGAVKQASTQLINSDTGVSHTISIGTQGYMPHEQIAGMPQFSSDLYALGMMGIQALTGRHPRTLVLDPHTGELDWQRYAPTAHPALVAVLQHMVLYNFRARYATATEALAALQTLPTDLLAHAYSPAADPAHIQAHAAHAPPSRSAIAGPTEVESPPSGLSHTDSTLPVLGSSPRADYSAGHPPVVPSIRPISGPTSGPKSGSSPTSVTTEVIPARPRQAPTRQPSTVQSSTAQPSAAHRPAPQHRGLPLLPAMATMVGILGIGLVMGRSLSPAPAAPEGVSPPVQPFPAEPQTSSNPSSREPSTTPSTNRSIPELPRPATPPTTPQSPIAELPRQNQAATTLLAQADALRQAKQYQATLALYDQVIAADSDRVEAYVGKCYSLNQLQDYRAATTACEQALTLDPNHINALWSMGFAQEQQNNYTAALRWYNQTLTADPTFAKAWNNKGTTLLSLGKHQEAIAAFDDAIALDETLAAPWNNRGAALWNLRQFGEALASVDRALELQPNYPEAQKLRQDMQQQMAR